MDKLDNLIQRLQNFDDNIETIAVQQAKQFEAEILDMNTEDQLYNKGQDARGISLGEYSPQYKKFKARINQPTNRVTLRLENEFQPAFFARFVGKFISIGSNDDKAEFLEAGYGKDIYGLNDKNLQELINMLKPEMQNEFKRQIVL